MLCSISGRASVAGVSSIFPPERNLESPSSTKWSRVALNESSANGKPLLTIVNNSVIIICRLLLTIFKEPLTSKINVKRHSEITFISKLLLLNFLRGFKIFKKLPIDVTITKSISHRSKSVEISESGRCQWLFKD